MAAGVGFILGGTLAFLAWRLIIGRRTRAAQIEVEVLLNDAQSKSKEMLIEAKEEVLKIKGQAESDIRERRGELNKQERRLSQKEENLDKKLDSIEKRERGLIEKEKEAENLRNQLQEIRDKQIQQLEMISGITSAEAKQLLIKAIEEEAQEDVNRRIREIEMQLKRDADEKSQEILSQSIQRLATSVVSENTVSVVSLPSDEMKGRLIGREGRNIRALENATGVDLIIDDTPEAVTISNFDPVRREIARIALEKLILDGRIHPARIEEMVNTARNEVEATIQSEGDAAAHDVGVPGIHPELIKLLGRLKYRYSYGQNVLRHSIEVAHLSGMIASELGMKIEMSKRAGLLHDIGKAVDFQIEGSHAKIGADIAKQWEKSADVINAIAEHHGESGTSSILGFVVSAADAISGGRPGARRESLEHYLKRLEALESVANSFDGVEKSYAIQAGREIRIMVKPVEVDDLSAMRLARDIVKKIEETMEYPGQIKVTVIRETRVVDYAK
ncbi:MAG: ribonuclease Y [Chloroflexota bacterium]|nr:ribonuclease Y [Chloroflexota bacterium]